MILTVVAMVKGFGYHRVQPAAIVCSVFLIVEAVIFLLFVVFIGCDQVFCCFCRSSVFDGLLW
eukprot:m.29038 g.29038  ORF g.29038 m.29038 type:complete len:63 (+) comp31125_c0_seq3:178-366(+)